jgi:hypothetical protein
MWCGWCASPSTVCVSVVQTGRPENGAADDGCRWGGCRCVHRVGSSRDRKRSASGSVVRIFPAVFSANGSDGCNLSISVGTCPAADRIAGGGRQSVTDRRAAAVLWRVARRHSAGSADGGSATPAQGSGETAGRRTECRTDGPPSAPAGSSVSAVSDGNAVISAPIESVMEAVGLCHRSG